MNRYKSSMLSIGIALLVSCHQESEYDASGTFEAEETIISAEASGALKLFSLEEGQSLNAGDNIGYIDTLQLYLRKKQLRSQILSTLAQMPDTHAQLAALQSQLQTALREQRRFTKLVEADAATRKQLDDVSAQVDLLKKQISAQRSSLDITTTSIQRQTSPLEIQVEQIDDQIKKSIIINPVSGTVLTKYAEKSEVVSVGKPLYKIADVSALTLRAYITGDQLPHIRLHQKVKVLTDKTADTYQQHEGIVSWISDKAEFTPKTIQTKDERANLVYAVKIRVRNDGYLKIGMYGEVKFL
ncbi:HlyD family secretion protein [Pararcticibacter amylolyticus]|uniref:HlyD family secretion protein n=1 Tax=Pararcticibacter amylolyticus TaxID=2173175 RepID=A0A2U2PIB9_9SPHI|nr:HlyD family efflux transporter periplasmic adaptor subunit [Pararcticibacter amylolyticus]PWG80899.1 HlyD family secretion protein [Pararcticibacter amylolyticus]